MCGVPWTLPESFTTSLRPVSGDSRGTVPSLVGTAVLAGQPGNSERAEESYVAWNDLGSRVEEACVSAGDGAGHSPAAAPSSARPSQDFCLQSAATPDCLCHCFETALTKVSVTWVTELCSF